MEWAHWQSIVGRRDFSKHPSICIIFVSLCSQVNWSLSWGDWARWGIRPGLVSAKERKTFTLRFIACSSDSNMYGNKCMFMDYGRKPLEKIHTSMGRTRKAGRDLKMEPRYFSGICTYWEIIGSLHSFMGQRVDPKCLPCNVGLSTAFVVCAAAFERKNWQIFSSWSKPNFDRFNCTRQIW